MKGKWMIVGSILAVLLLALVAGLTVRLSAHGEARAQRPQPQGGVGIQALMGTAPSAALGTGFTYQGQLKKDGNPVNGNGTDDIADIQSTAYDLDSLVYLPLVAANWRQPWPTPTVPPSDNVCRFNPTNGVVFATSMEHPYWYQLANRGNSGSVLAPYPPNRVYYSYPNNVSIVTSPVRRGAQAQQFQNLAGTHEPSTAFKYALPRSDVYYWRFYRQYEAGYQFTCESKAFTLYAHNPITFTLPAGQRPDGTNEASCFLQMMPNCWYDNRAHVTRCFDPEGVNDRGEPVLYCYHLDQPTGYGEKFRQNVGTPRYITSGQWIDFQMMMKLNTPGQADGEIKLWIDGELKMHYNTVRFRTVPELQLNAVALGGYIGGHCTSVRDQKIWDDHYMVSKVYITDAMFNAMCETKTEWFDYGEPYLWDLERQCWPGVNCR